MPPLSVRADVSAHDLRLELRVAVAPDELATAARASAQRGGAAGTARVLQAVVREVEAALRARRAWVCDACGKPALKFVHGIIPYLHVPPPDGPFVYDTVQPVCAMRGACEAECTRRNEALRQQVFGERGGPEHAVMQCSGAGGRRAAGRRCWRGRDVECVARRFVVKRRRDGSSDFHLRLYVF